MSDAELQADCDHVDRCERAESRLMFALKDMGYAWKIGTAAYKSEYGIPYQCWSNGHKLEGDATAWLASAADVCIPPAIDMFQVAKANGAKFIVWRIPPKIESNRDNRRAEPVLYKLYFRWHFLNEIPEDYGDVK